MQTTEGPAVDQTAEFAELRRPLDVADDAIALVNKWLDEAQGMCFCFGFSANIKRRRF